MTGKVLDVCDIVSPDHLATQITDRWIEWDNMRASKKNDWEEIRRYVYATDTTKTTNSKLPWKNKTTIPKLCQIRDNLFANYTATTFPQRKSVIWEANEKDANSRNKRDAITNYMSWAMDHPSFKNEVYKIILDYIDFGNCFVTVEWTDERVQTEDKTQSGYVGPTVRRINPLDIVFNPTAEDFNQSPKIIRSITSLGEIKELLQKETTPDNRDELEALYDYLKDIRSQAASAETDWSQRDNLYQMDGFTSFRQYLLSDYVEVLTFYGDIYDQDSDVLLKNHVITVVDRHKLIGKKPNPSFFGNPPIFHSPWRKKQDNIWGMGPLDNLIGMQYRIDHVENMKADIYDLVTFPVIKVKGFVQDFDWQPGERIYTSDGDVELLTPEVNVLQANLEIDNLQKTMEEMAGAPREAMGFRTPGEKTKYEVQSLENAASRVFQNKITQFEEQVVEPVLNAMLEMARRNLVGSTVIRVFDDELRVASFQALTVQDITGIGRIKPVAARHFAEQAQLIQNLTSLSQSQIWPFIQSHFSGIKIAKVIEDIFNLKDYEIVLPYIALAEQADAQRQVQVLQEQVAMEAGTATGIGTDFDLPSGGNPVPANNIPVNQ